MMIFPTGYDRATKVDYRSARPETAQWTLILTRSASDCQWTESV